MGLLDFLNQDSSGYGGLFGGQYFPTIEQPKLPNSQIEYDAAGNPMGVSQAPAPSPFPQWSPSQSSAPPQMTAQAPIFAGSAPYGMPQPTPQAPALPPPINVQPRAISNPVAMADPAPDPAALPGNAQQAQYQAPQPSQPDGPGFGDRLMAGLTNFGAGGKSGGLIGALSGGINGLASGQRQDAAGIQQQQQSQTFKALKDAGMPEKLAFAAALNPELLKQIAPQYFSKPQLQETGTDPLTGQKTFAQYDSTEGTLKPLNGGAQSNQTAGSFADLQKAQAAGITGEALYEYVPKGMQGAVKAMIEGRQPLPSPQAMRNPATLALIDAAHSIDPTFDATSWQSRVAGAKDFTSGKSSEMVRAANQTLAHVGSLLDAMDNLKNTRFPAWNAVGNAVNEQLGAGQPGAFRTNAHAVAEEMSKVFKGANLSDAEIRQWESNLSENMSPEQQKTQIGKLSELLHGSLSALEEKRLASIGPMAAEKAGSVIKPEGMKTLERIDQWVKGNATQSSGSIPSGWTVKVH